MIPGEVGLGDAPLPLALARFALDVLTIPVSLLRILKDRVV